MSFNEQKLKLLAVEYLQKAREGDWAHALRVVDWVKKLGKNRSDLYLLVTAAYIHDVGWSGIAPKGKINFDEMLKLEPKANENSSRLICEILSELKFNNQEIKTIKRLVKAADKHESQLEDEEIIVDADSLSKLCIEHVKEKYQPESYPKLINLWEKELFERIKTQEGKSLLPKLLNDLKEKIILSTN